MDTNSIQYLKAQDLRFDLTNPRLVEFNIKNTDPETKILNILWSEMAVDEIVMSILAHGFFEHEAMYAVRENRDLIIVEGNRRLAAVKAILNPELIDNSGMKKFESQITPELKESLETHLPVLELSNREEAWRYIGFKHVNGAAKWGSYAKAEYIASVHERFEISLDDIAKQIGDTNKTVIKLYQGLMILRQAEKDTAFKMSDIYNSKLYFSHLYTAIGYEGFQKFLGISPYENNYIPISDDKKQNLEDTMLWLFGSKDKDIRPVINSQNPDLRNLDRVLQNKEATISLRAKGNLELAYDLSLNGIDVFSASLTEAKTAIQKALSKLPYFNGEEELLKSAGTIADSADMLYSNMERAYSEKNGLNPKKRISE